MRIAAFLIVGPGEADRWLEDVLKQLHWVDDVCVCLNNPDAKTEQLVRKYADLVHEDHREWGREQWRIKQDFLDVVISLAQPDWVWCLDADEIFDPRFDRAMAEKMAAGQDVAWYFWCMQLWNDPARVRMDLSFPNIRYFKVVTELGLNFLAQALHCGLAPMYAYRFGSQSGLWFKHYGLMKAEDRAKKVARYDRYDPAAKYKGKSWYDGLRNERAASIPFEEAAARVPEFIYRSKPVRASHMSKDKQLFVFQNKAGKVVEAVGEKQREEFLRRGFKELADIKVNPNPEAPVVKAPEKKEAPAAAPEEKKDEPANLEAGAKGGAPASAAPKRKRPSKKA